jgi:hypothetical protein
MPRHHVATVCLFVLVCSSAPAQVAVSGRVLDETGAAVGGATVELKPASGGPELATSSNLAGNFSVSLPAAGEYEIRAERQGFYQFHAGQRFDDATALLTISLNHQRELSERIEVTYSPPAIDPQQASDHKELDNTEIQAVPYAAPQDYRASLPLMNGVVQDNAGHMHFNGADTRQTSFNLDGFNVSDPVTGGLDARVNIDAVQSMELETGQFAADSGRGSAGVLDLKTKMGDDRFRFGGTNFLPGFSTESGLHLSKWTPRLEFSGPLVRSRAWFYHALDAFYFLDTVHGLPNGQNRTRGLTATDLSRIQVNLTPANILTGSFLYNLSTNARQGLSMLNPAEATSNERQTTYISTVRDTHYFGRGVLLEMGFADTRTLLRDLPQGTELFEITPLGNRGNYFVNLDRHAYRQQGVATFFFPVFKLLGTHQLKAGIDFEREAFHQTTLRHDYEFLRDDGSVARFVSFEGSPFEARKDFDGAEYVEDRWNPRQGLFLEAGLRMEWNEIVRETETAPRFSVAWAPRGLRDTKFSAGWGIYYDAIPLDTVTRQQDQSSLATFYSPEGVASGTLLTQFQVDGRTLKMPYYSAANFSVDRRLPGGFFLKLGYTRRSGARGFTFSGPPPPPAGGTGTLVYQLTNARRERYGAMDVSVRQTFAGRFEWFAGYTRSGARSNAAVEYSLENPIFAAQAPGPFAWDTPNRFHMWGWAPLPQRLLPKALQFITRNTTAAYLVEYRTGFPFSSVDEDGYLVGLPGSLRFPDYFSANISLERKFGAIHYLWAWRVAVDNVTNNGNPNVVNNIIGTSEFLTYARGQARALSVRLRFLGRK